MDTTLISQQVADKLLAALQARFPEDASGLSGISTLIRPMVALGMAEGEAAVDRVVEGLLLEDSYPAWRELYAQATAVERIAMNDGQRKALMLNSLSVLSRRQQLWSILKITAGIVGSAILAL